MCTYRVVKGASERFKIGLLCAEEEEVWVRRSGGSVWSVSLVHGCVKSVLMDVTECIYGNSSYRWKGSSSLIKFSCSSIDAVLVSVIEEIKKFKDTSD